ncbi:hypothetical protein D3C78_947600 [compost metagenome]
MVYAMIGRRNEQPFEPTQLGDVPGVHPELIEQVQCCHRDKYQRWHAQHCQGQVEDPRQEEAAAGLTQGCRQVVLLTLVMHRMRRPEDVALMTKAVQPVVAEIVQNKGQDPDPQRVAGQREQRQMVPGHGVGNQAYTLGQQARGCRQHPGAEAVDRIGQTVSAHAPQAIGDQFDHNQDKEKRYRQQNQIHGSSISRLLHKIRPGLPETLWRHLPI